jgi:glutamate-ammonia-ligase adenylyltransferase
VEFIAQCFQLIRGGRDRLLRARAAAGARVPARPSTACRRRCVSELRAPTVPARYVEHAIQAWEDRQTQELPADETAAPALAHSMGFATGRRSAAALGASPGVEQHFAELIAEPEALRCDAQAGTLLDALTAMQASSRSSASRTRRARWRALDGLYASRRVQSLQAEGRERLDRFMPMLLRACGEARDPDLALARLCPWSAPWPGAVPTCCC